MPAYYLRPATHADHDFLYRLHVAAMRALVTQIWGWDDAWQQQHFDDHFDPSLTRIVVVDGVDAGVVTVEWQADAAFIRGIEILPDYQGRGLGAAVIREAIADAAARGLPVTLQVLKINPARRLYERLGFSITGMTETHYQMRTALPE
jgi:ribosomal protein S18 acetylase RimI-like enzyme